MLQHALTMEAACQQQRESEQSANCHELTVACMSGSSKPPETSLTTCAPAATASLATAALKVSTEMGTPCRALSWASALQQRVAAWAVSPCAITPPTGALHRRLHMQTSMLTGRILPVS